MVFFLTSVRRNHRLPRILIIGYSPMNILVSHQNVRRLTYLGDVHIVNWDLAKRHTLPPAANAYRNIALRSLMQRVPGKLGIDCCSVVVICFLSVFFQLTSLEPSKAITVQSSNDPAANYTVSTVYNAEHNLITGDHFLNI